MKKVSKFLKEIFGEEYPNLRMAYNYPEKIYGIAGNYQTAIDCLEKAIKISVKGHYQDDDIAAKFF